MKKITQEYMGRNQLIDRLTAQMGGNRQAALSVLEKRGHVKPGTEELTAEGKKRDAMTAEERAIDRAKRSSATKRAASAYTYDPKTNRATLKPSAKRALQWPPKK